MPCYDIFYDVHYVDGRVLRVVLETPRNPPPPLHEQAIEWASRRTGRTDAVKVTLPFRGNAVLWQRPLLRIFRGDEES